ncbi:tRNA dihydrouridine synthase DusB [bacterium]|nr:tRNA dihydrouridine synthase DusB [bacterium]
MLKIGPITADPGILLAPMEDISELPFRLICKELGADIVYTEFVNAEGLIREDPDGPRRSFRKLRFLEAERPLGIQIYGAAGLSMERAAEIATAQNPDIIDINCGCWVSNVALRGAGAGLLRDLPLMKEIVTRVIGATHLPVTVKTRLGWDQHSIRIVEVAKMLEDIGVQALAIHCRTRAQGHKGAVDYEWITKVKQAVSIPVVLNGDVVSAAIVQEAFDRTGCDGVMIGRGAIAHPWIFREAQHYLKTGELLPEPSLKERAELCIKHVNLALEHDGERYVLIGMRRHYAGYFRGLRGASRLRAELAGYRELAPLMARLEELRDTDPERIAA